jgi:hypothetical protein
MGVEMKKKKYKKQKWRLKKKKTENKLLIGRQKF